MKLAPEHIPNLVTDDIVYSAGGQHYRAVQGQIVPSVESSTEHSLVKMVVSTNKVEVYRHLMNRGFSLQHQNLIFLACQHGCQEMVIVLMETGVSVRSRKNFYLDNCYMLCYSVSSLTSSQNTGSML